MGIALIRPFGLMRMPAVDPYNDEESDAAFLHHAQRYIFSKP